MLKDQSCAREQHRQAPSLIEGGEARPTHQGRKKKVSDCLSRRDGAEPPSNQCQQLTFGWDGDDEPGLAHEVDRRPALRARNKASKFAPGQMVFEWFEHPPTDVGD